MWWHIRNPLIKSNKKKKKLKNLCYWDLSLGAPYNGNYLNEGSELNIFDKKGSIGGGRIENEETSDENEIEENENDM